MEITEVRVTLRNEEKLKGFANITLDNQIVIRGLKIIAGTSGYFVSMPSRKRPDGSHQDIAHPVNSQTRKMVEDKVLCAYEELLKSSAPSAPGATGATGSSSPSSAPKGRDRNIFLASDTAEIPVAATEPTEPTETTEAAESSDTEI